MGIFRSEEKEKAQFTAAYNTWFDRLYAGECASRGEELLSPEVLVQIHRLAVDQAVIETYKPGQHIRVSDIQIESMFADRRNAKLLAHLENARRKQTP